MTNHASVKRVCKICLEKLENSEDCAHNKEFYVRVKATEFVIRPKPSEEQMTRVFYGTYKLCWDYPDCPRRDECTFAHGDNERDGWNGTYAILKRCVLQNICKWGRFKELISKTCSRTDLHKIEENRQIVYVKAKKMCLKKIRPLPRNKNKMKKRGHNYKFKHNEVSCPQQSHQDCLFPHSHEEEEVWNLLMRNQNFFEMKNEDELVNTDPEIVPGNISIPCEFGASSEFIPRNSLPELGSMELTVATYKVYFRTLLYLEEDSRWTRLRDRCNDPYTVTFILNYDDFYCKLYPAGDTTEFQVAAEYADQYAGTAHIKLQNEEVIYCNEIKFVKGRPSYLRLNIKEDLRSVEEKLGCHIILSLKRRFVVEFLLNRSYFDTLHKSIEALTKETIKRVLLSEVSRRPCRPPENVSRYTPPASLILDDDIKVKALKSIFSCSPFFPFLLTGPFGTGKTRLIARLAHQVVSANTIHAKKVLICVHHNQTANTYIDKYFGPLKGKHSVGAYRLLPYSRSKPENEFFHLYWYISEMQDFLKNSKCQIIITTYTAARLLHMKPGYFSHILLDEAAQCPEPEAMVPFIYANKDTKIVLAGDHLQSGPQDEMTNSEAKKHGLCTSLLERLHAAYMKNSILEDSFIKSLLTNYRCHEGILHLSSRLFYNCSLLSQTDSKVHPNAPHPLLFICSSLDEKKTCHNGTDSNEADILLQKASYYLSRWPDEWGEFFFDEVCIMTRTHKQQVAVRRVMQQNSEYSNSAHLDQDQVRVTFTIQGLEFRMVLLSTYEDRTYTNGGTLQDITDPGKTVANERTFNTILTRAKSLFVAVGNPFYLLDAEECLISKGFQKTHCWRAFLRTCMDRNSIEFPGDSNSDAIKRLQARVYEGNLVEPRNKGPVDSIIQKSKDDYRQKMVELLRKKKTYLHRGAWTIIHKDQGEKRTGRSENSPTSGIEGILQCKAYNKGEVIPFDNKLNKLKVLGLKSRRGAFSGDTVIAVPLKGDNQLYRIDNVKKRSQETFLCRVDPNNCNMMIPLDIEHPKFVNFPEVARVCIQQEDDSLKRSRNGPVACFDQESMMNLKEDNPRLRDTIPLEDAKRMIFLVLFIRWGKTHYLPLGAVIDVFPLAHSFFHAERMLMAQYMIDRAPDSPLPPDPRHHLNKPPSDADCFTIDHPGTVTLDDALSLKLIEKKGRVSTYQFGVHITQVVEDRQHGSEIFKQARTTCCTIYEPSPSGTKRYSMISPELAQQFSLDVDQPRECISVLGKVKVTQNSPTNPFSIKIVDEDRMDIKIETITSKAQLTYDFVETILLTDYTRSGVSELYRKLHLIHLISLELKQLRLRGPPESVFYQHTIPYETDHSNYRFPRASGMVEEMMIWANMTVSQFMLAHQLSLPIELVPLRCQDSPTVSDLEVQKVPLQETLLPYANHPPNHEGQCSIKIPIEVAQYICSRRQSEDVRCNLLMECNFPEIACKAANFKTVQRRAEYRLVNKESNIPGIPSHFSLNCNYTHFTSPLRRCFDLLVHMVILEILERRVPYAPNSDDLKVIVQDCNKAAKNAKQFDSSMYRVIYAISAFQSSKPCVAYIRTCDEHHCLLHFADPEMKSLSKQTSTVRLAALKTPILMDKDKMCIRATWKYKICSLAISKLKDIFDSKVFLASDTASHKTLNQGLIIQAHHTPSDHGDPKCLNRSSHECEIPKNVITLDSTSNLKLLHKHCYREDHSNAVILDLEKALQRAQPISNTLKINKESKEKHTNTLAFCNVKVDLTLAPCSIMRVWVGASVNERIISPEVLIFSPISNLDICVQHNKSPAECFSTPILQNASHIKYDSIDVYVDQWEPVLLAEGAKCASEERSMTFLKDATLHFDGAKFKLSSTTLEEPHYYYDQEADVFLEVSSEFYENNWSYFTMAIGDFICARYQISVLDKDSESAPFAFEPAHRGVLHMVIKSVNTVSRIIAMKFIGRSNGKFSKKVRSLLQEGAGGDDDQCSRPNCNHLKCTLELIYCPIPMRRIYRTLIELKDMYRQLQKQKSDVNAAFPVALKTSECDVKRPNKIGQHLQDADIAAIVDIQAAAGSLNEAVCKLWPKHESDPISRQESLNREQIGSIKMAMKFDFSLIQGPPGTGKSVTGAHLAYALAMYNIQHPNQKEWYGQKGKEFKSFTSPVMYCGPSNKAVDRVLDLLHRLVQHNYEVSSGRPLKILRLYSKAVEHNDFPGPFADKSSFPVEAKDESCPDHYKEYALHHIIRKKYPKIHEADQEFSRNHKDKKPPISEAIEDYRTMLFKAELNILTNEAFVYDIILCTCNEAASHRVKSSIRPAFCIIDEAAMATEPESLAPSSISDHVVLIGDHKQLQPVIKHAPAAINGLCVSLFERFASYEGFKTSPHFKTLETQYRMHEAICRFPSEFFYEGKLNTDRSVMRDYETFMERYQGLRTFWREPDSPIMFCHIEGKESQSGTMDSTVAVHSKSNEIEARYAINIVCRLLIQKHKVQDAKIAILTPYKGQKRLLEEKLKIAGNYGNVEIRTIHESQGDEFDIVILSTVRSLPKEEYDERIVDLRWKRENLGFLTNQHQICVAITRAKYGLIIVGNSDLLNCDEETWRELINHYEDAGAYRRQRFRFY